MLCDVKANSISGGQVQVDYAVRSALRLYATARSTAPQCAEANYAVC